jgi:hypothetical protein
MMSEDHEPLDYREEMRQWDLLRDQALAEVRAGLAVNSRLRSSRLLLRTLEVPAFHDAVGWELFALPASDSAALSYMAHRTAWMRTADQSAFYDPNGPLATLRRRIHGMPEPTIVHNAVTPDMPIVEDILQRLSAIRIPLMVPSHGVGLDGTHFELHLGDHWNSVVLHWWMTTPEEWRGVEEAIHSLWDHLEACFKASQEAADGSASR